MRRILGRSGIEISAVGVGCWATGGLWTFKGAAAGWARYGGGGQAASGREALEIVDGCRPDVVLMDGWMPVMDGVPALLFDGICQITVQPVSHIVRHSNDCSSG